MVQSYLNGAAVAGRALLAGLYLGSWLMAGTAWAQAPANRSRAVVGGLAAGGALCGGGCPPLGPRAPHVAHRWFSAPQGRAPPRRSTPC